MSRRRSWIQDVTVEIDLDEELDDETLLEMARERGLIGSPARLSDVPDDMSPREFWERLAHELRTAMHNGERTHFEILLHRMVDTAAPEMAPKLTHENGRSHA